MNYLIFNKKNYDINIVLKICNFSFVYNEKENI